MGKVSRTTLRSGIKVITEEVADIESATIGIWVKTGSRNESARNNGISHFIEHLLFKGTERRSSLEISRSIEAVGGSLNAFTSREYTCFYAKVRSKDLPLAVDLLSDIFLNSKFDAEEVEKERLVVLQEIRMVEDTPDDIIHDMFMEEFWKGHPLGRPILGRAKGVGRLSSADIADYYDHHYRSNSVFISAAGALKHGDLVEALKPLFGGLEKRDAIVDKKRTKRNKVLKVVKRDLEQVHICMGVPMVSHRDENRYHAYLMNTILGGGMSSRLFQEIREKRGLAYSVYSYLNLYKDTGAFMTYAGTSREHFRDVVSITLDEFAKLRRGVTEEELRDAKEQLKGGMVLGLESTSSRMMKLAKDEIFHGRYVPLKKVMASIDRVTVDDIKRCAQKYLKTSNVGLLALGNVTKRSVPSVLKEG